MKPSEQAKKAGLDSLAQVSEMTEQSTEKLARWSRDRPRLFEIILQGCLKVLEMGESKYQQTK